MDKHKIILLIDDDQMIREIYTFALEKAGFEVLAADTPEQGTELIKQHADAKLILLDVIMPRMNGVEVLKAIKSNIDMDKIPVILLSNLTDDEIIDEAMKLGAYGYLVKAQYSPTQLVDKVKEIIEFHDKKVN